MIRFSADGVGQPRSQVDDIMRRQFLDRLADVQVACWGADPDTAEAPEAKSGRKYNTNGADPILTAAPETILLGLANLADAQKSGSHFQAAALSDDHFATWDQFDKNRELLSVAKTLTINGQIRARRAMLSAGVVGCILAASMGAIGWLFWSSIDGLAANAGASASPSVPNGQLRSPIADRPDVAPVLNNQKDKSVDRGQAASVSAAELAERFSEPDVRHQKSGSAVDHPHFKHRISIDVTPDGEVPLGLNVADARHELSGSHATLSNIPNGVVPTVGAMADGGRWIVEAEQLSELKFVLGTSPPKSFDIHVAIHTRGGQFVTALGMSIELRFPEHLSQKSAKIEQTPMAKQNDAVLPAAKVERVESKIEEPAVSTRVQRALKASPPKSQVREEEVPSPKRQVKPQVRQLEVLDTSRQMGVGASAASRRPTSASTPSANAGSAGTWWKKPLPGWAHEITSNQ